MAARRPAARSLWPREHGAYVQLLVPLCTALIATGGSAASAAIAIGACLAFVASEPLRVVVGARGARLRETAGARARVRLALLGAAAMLVGGAGLALAPRSALWLSALVAVPLGFVLVAATRRAEGTVLGELAAAVGLAGAAAPVAVAGGMRALDALTIWGAWSMAYATTVIAVHHVIARHRRADRGRARLGRWLGVALAGAGLAALIAIAPIAWFAAPLAAAAVVVLVVTPPATRLRAIGVAFLAISLVAALCAVTAARRVAPEPAPARPGAAQLAG
ncbi:MAG: YwiC-like family protein [Myxococcales bacterium]|nr:YwiC-like family protein [Myxococcales bacterium]